MRAMVIEGFGGTDQFRPMALPRPEPGPGEVLIHVVSAGVNPVDCLIRSGRLREHIACEFPLVLGWDVAGAVEEMGPGAGRFRKGDRVWACARKPVARWGTYAEYVAVPEGAVARMPARLLFEEAAAVPLAALAAQQSLVAEGSLEAGQTVLIHGAGGGVGHFAVQLAKQRGARVLGTGSAATQPFILGLGADGGIDYTAEDFREALRRHAPEGADLVVDLVGGDTLERSYEIVKPGGRLVSLADEPDAEAAAARGIRAHSQFVEPDGDVLEQIGRLFDTHALKTCVQKIYPLSRVAEAHETLEARHVKGKLVLNL